LIARVTVFVAATLFGLWKVFLGSDSTGGRVAGVLLTCYFGWNVYRAYRSYGTNLVQATSN
jgi:F0F1-type ATP synthase assembly protein I